jgi:hypothetical protein
LLGLLFGPEDAGGVPPSGWTTLDVRALQPEIPTLQHRENVKSAINMSMYLEL